MPKLSKFRIINAHYAQMKNKHANTLIDLSKDNEAHHSLLTLENGCGKGVMNQLLSQLLLPETNWGENNGNRILDMFYNDKKEFHSYPMHIILEWQLDSKKPSWLITGMCITAEGKYSEEDEESVRLKYFSYITKRDLSEANFLKNIPLYSNKKVLSYDDTKNYISNQPNYSMYSKTNMNNRTSSYYKRLNEYGIYKNEWEIMKDINTEEGGVSRYFNKAQDNTSLFNELIIPAIVENMKSDYDSQEVLRNIFTSNLSIIENLPLLIKRSEDHKNIIYLISPLIKSINNVIRREKLLNNSFNKGMSFFKTIKALEEKNKDEKEKWKEILQKDKEKLVKSNFNKKSIEYSKDLKLNEELKNKLENVKSSIESNKNDLDKLNKKSHIYKLNEYLIPLNKLEEKSLLIKERINILLNEKSLKEKKKAIEKTEEKLKDDFENIKEFIIEKVNNHYGYKKYLKKSLSDNKKILEDYNKKIDNLNIELSDIKYFLKEFNKLKDKVLEKYSLLELSMPTNIKNDIEIEIDKLKKDLKATDKNIVENKNNKDRLTENFNEIDRFIYTKKEKLKNLNKKYDEIYKKESNIKKLIYKNIPEIDVEEMFNKRNLNKLIQKVESLINEKEKRIDEISKKMWINNQDRVINTKDYWIPNEEIVNIQKIIKEKNISALSGMEFINLENSFDQKNNLLFNYPLLPYSMVVDNKKSYNKLVNILKDKHFRYPVPIYIREKMHKKAKTPYEVIQKGQKEMILSSNKFNNWLNSLNEEYDKYKKIKELLKNKINNLNILYNKLNEKQNRIFSIDLKVKIKELKENLKDKEIELDNIKRKIEDKKNKIDNLENKKIKINNNLDKMSNNLVLINKYINMNIEKKDKEKLKKKILTKKETFQDKIKKINNENEEINNNIFSINQLFKKYKDNIIRKIDKLESFIKIDYKSLFNKKSDFSYKKEPNYLIENNKFWDLLDQRDDLLKSIKGKNSEIKILQNDLKNIIENKNDKVNKLEKLDENWTNYEILSLSIEKLNKMIVKTDHRIKEKNMKIQSLKQEFSKLEGKIESKNEYLNKFNATIKKEFGQVAKVFKNNLDKKEIDIINNQNNLKRAIKKANEKIQKFDSKKETLFNLHTQITEKIHLDKNKGKLNEKYFDLKKINRLKTNIEKWEKTYEDNKKSFLELENKYKEKKNNILDELKEMLKEEILKQKIVNAFQYFSNRKYIEIKSVLESIIKSSKNALNSIDKSKKQAEEIKSDWANRASGYIIKVSNSLKTMINSMIYVNENDYEFPLVKLKGKEVLPDKKDDELKYLLSDFFVDAVKKIKALDKPVQEVSNKEISKIVSTKKIFNYVLKGSYPTLLVYKMSEKNEFRSKKPSASYYETWDGITVGKGVSTEGSGGQKLSISTFLMMMLLNFKKSKNLLDENLSTVLIMDNPFSNASSRHVLDPIFKIADQLGFQIIAFAPPEIVKEEISERFPVFWTMRLEMLQDSGINLLKNKLVYGGRRYKPEVFGK